MRQSETQVRRIEKAEKKQEKILVKKKAHMRKVSLKGDSESLKKAKGEVDGAQQALERIREDKMPAEKAEDGKIYSAGNKPRGIKLKEKLTSLKGKIRVIRYKRVDSAKTVDKRLSIWTFLAKMNVGAKKEDKRWIEPAMCFLVAISSVICYLYSRASLFMVPPPPRASMDWYYGLARLDFYQGVFLWLIMLAILGGLFLIRYRKIGVPILILGGFFQFLLSPIYLISSQPPTPSFQSLALMPVILATCLVLISIIAWIRKPLPKERVEGLKKRLKRKKEVPASSEGVMEQRETFRIPEETNAQENAVSDQKNEAIMKAAISNYLVDSDPDIEAHIRRICYDALWIESCMERSKTIELKKYPDFISTCRSEYLDWLNELERSKEPGLSDSELSIYTERIKLCDVMLDSLDSEQMYGYPEVVEDMLIEERNKVIGRIEHVLKPFFDVVSVELEGNITMEDQIRVFMSAYLAILGDSESAPIWILQL
jgi:hypothetical protein